MVYLGGLPVGLKVRHDKIPVFHLSGTGNNGVSASSAPGSGQVANIREASGQAS